MSLNYEKRHEVAVGLATARPRRRRRRARFQGHVGDEAAKWADNPDADARRGPGQHLPRAYRRQHPRRRSDRLHPGLNIHFSLIQPKKGIDVVMIAPKGPGHTVSGEYRRAAACRASWRSRRMPPATPMTFSLSFASAIGGGRSGIIETTFREECRGFGAFGSDLEPNPGSRRQPRRG